MQHTKAVPYTRKHKADIMRFDNLNEFAATYRKQKFAVYQNTSREGRGRWYGAPAGTFDKELRDGNTEYAAKADKYLDQFANAVLETAGIDYTYNYEYGVIDAGMYNSGDPMCLYGPSPTESDRAPIRIYIDTWISSTISAETILSRGIAVLALVRAVSIYRPVILEMIGGWGSMTTGKSGIVTCAAPTNPMDLSRAAWMVAAPQFVRMGMMSMFYECIGTDKVCGMPALGAGLSWQEKNLGAFLAEQDGADPDHTVFLPLMYDNGIWTDQKACLRWVKEQAARFMPVMEDAA